MQEKLKNSGSVRKYHLQNRAPLSPHKGFYGYPKSQRLSFYGMVESIQLGQLHIILYLCEKDMSLYPYRVYWTNRSETNSFTL